MKEVYSYQEIQPLITKGQAISFTCHVHAELTTIQKQPGSDTVTATIHILVGEYVTAVVECEYPSIVSLLDAFDINESLEIWEVKPGSDKWDYAEPHTGEGIYKE
jgi:hypothetical protein